MLIYRHIKRTAQHKQTNLKKFEKSVDRVEQKWYNVAVNKRCLKKHIVGDRYNIEPWQLQSNNSVAGMLKYIANCVMSQKLESH